MFPYAGSCGCPGRDVGWLGLWLLVGWLGGAGTLDAHVQLAPSRFGVAETTGPEERRTCASPLHSIGCSRSLGRRSPALPSPTTGSWSPCAAGPAATAARAAAGLGGYDHSTRRWRHLDLAASKLWLEAEIWRVACRSCARIRTEAVPWARPGARLTRDLEVLIAWLAQRTDKTSTCRLVRVSWETVQAVVMRVVDEHLDDRRPDGVFNLGVDEISYKRGHQYLTVVANHDTGRVLWVAKGRNRAALTSFFDALGPDRCTQVEAISMDLAPI
jgi:hypothetical protein